MKLFFYINVLCNGGAERVISNVANMMSSKGHDCTIVTSFATTNEYQTIQSVKRYNLSENRIEGFWGRNIFLTYRLRRLIKKERPDILVAFMAEPNFRACISCIGLSTKTVISVRNDPRVEYGGLLKFLSKIVFRFSDGIVFQTEEAKEFFPKKIRDKGTIIYNSVREDFFKIQPSTNPTGIVTTGRLASQKNHKLLIEAFSLIADIVKDDLTIYGSGNATELIDYARQLGLAERVHIPGAIKDVPNTIKDYKLYVLSSNYEGMPNALMEAMALGLPCISTDCPCGGPRTLFSKEMQQYLAPVKDARKLSKLMLELLTDNEKRILHGENCRKQALSYHPSVIDRIWESYLTQFI